MNMDLTTLKKHNRYKVLVFFSFAFLFQAEVFGMAFFGLKLCVFSAVKGTVVKEGMPLPNVLVKRTYKWDGESITDEVTTDAAGNFSFPEQNQRSVIAIFPHNPSVSQGIKIYLDGKEYRAWAYQKGNYDVNGELDGKPMNLLCDLNNPEQKHEVNNYKIYTGICELR
jgi:hypothetical protein